MLIGLSGRAGSGKDTVYGFIKEWGEEQGLVVKREAFADRLKLSAARIFFPDIELEDAVAWCNEVKESGHLTVSFSDYERLSKRVFERITGRRFLQVYGTEAHRDVFGNDFWISAVLDVDHACDVLVITDARFENEAATICLHGGFMWEILRPGATHVEAHVSEQPLPADMIDDTIVNSGTLDDLRVSVFRRLGMRW